MYVCLCNAVTERQVRQAVSAGAQTLKQLREELQVTKTCGGCMDCVKQYLPQVSTNQAA